jgi:hypothetical protein
VAERIVTGRKRNCSFAVPQETEALAESARAMDCQDIAKSPIRRNDDPAVMRH